MAYSIQYGPTVKRRIRKRIPGIIPIIVLFLVMLLRIYADPYFRQAQKMIWGAAESVEAFYEVFVKDGILG